MSKIKIFDSEGKHQELELVHSFMQKMKLGEYFTPFPFRTYATHALVADQLYLMPFIVPRDMTIDRLAIKVSTGDAGKIARLGIYKDGDDLYPGELVVDAGTVDVGSTAVVAATIDQALKRGLYWIALVSDGTPTLQYTTPLIPLLGIPSASLDINLGRVTWTKAAVGSAALATPCVAGAAATYEYHFAVAARLKSLD